MSEIKYLLGIDGGGTKTEFLLTDISGRVIKRCVLGASNPVSAGIENTKNVLIRGIAQVCKGTDRRAVSVFAGLAGGISGNNRALINGILADCGFGVYANGSDTDSALEAALGGKDGVAVIMGTGVVAFSCVGGVRHRVGGWGYLVDKGGSGFNYGADALDSAFRCLDGRGGSSLLLQLIEEKTAKPLADSVADIYSGGAAYVASFAPLVFEAYKLGDSEAERIIDRNTNEIAQIIRTGCGFLSGAEKLAVLCGGLCSQREILTPFLRKHLGSEHSFTFLNEPIINGAISLAKRGAKNA